MSLATVEGAAARTLVDRALSEGSGPVRAGALEALAVLDATAAMAAALTMADTDGASEVRVAAVTLLGRARSDAALDVLLAALDDRSPSVARAASDALADFENPDATARIAARLTPASLEVLSSSAGTPRGRPDVHPTPQHAARRTQQAESEQAQARIRYVERTLAVLARRGGPGAAEAAVAVLDHPHPVVRDAAVSVVVALRDAAGIAALTRWLDAPDPGRRRAAIRAVLALGPGPAYERLAPGLTPHALAASGASAGVAEVFEQVLYGDGAADADPRWSDLALSLLTDPTAHGWAIDYLRERKDPRALDAFVACLAAPSADHASLLDALGELGDRRATTAVLDLLGTPRVPLWWVLHALERLDDPEAVATLRQFAEAQGGNAEIGRQVAPLIRRLARDRTLDGA